MNVTGLSTNKQWQHFKFKKVGETLPDKSGVYNNKSGYFFEADETGGYCTYKKRNPALKPFIKGKLADYIKKTSSLAEIINLQMAYADLFESKDELLESHTTVGIELEFAKHTIDGVGPHDIVATNQQAIIASIGGEWVLEGDDGNKLEISVPPMLVPLGQHCASSITHIYDIFRAEIQSMLTSTQDGTTMVELLEGMYQIGVLGDWNWQDDDFKNGTLTSNNNGLMGLDCDEGREINARQLKTYGQLNIAMSIEGACELVAEGRKKWPEQNTHGGKQWVLKSINAVDAVFKHTYKNTNFRRLWSRSLGSLIAAAHYSNKDWVGSLVKETDGVWIKAPVPTKIDLAIKNNKQPVKDKLCAYLNDASTQARWVEALEQVTSEYEQALHINIADEPREADFRFLVKAMVDATVTKITHNTDVVLADTRKERNVKSESGEGVRGDTLLTHNVGTELAPRVLTEVRSDVAIDALLR